MVFKRALIVCFSLILLAGCSSSKAPAELPTEVSDSALYSREGREAKVEFSAVYISNYQSLEDFKQMEELRPNVTENIEIPRLLTYLDGPLAYRDIGAVRSGKVTIDPASAYMTQSGFVALKYKYQGTWLLKHKITKSFPFPIPFNTKLIQTESWLKCTDQAPQHQNLGFYFYYWDPSRPGCDQKIGPHYQMVAVNFKEVPSTKTSHPEYERMLTSGGQNDNMQMTFAFGYVSEPKNPNPYMDEDLNMQNFRKFLERVRLMAKILDFKETPILQKEYLGAVHADQQIGSRFVGVKNKIRFEVKVVAATDIDQTEIVAKSFAHDHDAFTAWFGHSRVGSEQDAMNVKSTIESYPEFYSISKDYQILYWAGCTSYSYYVEPFFKLKTSKDLDIVTNGYSSLFNVYEKNALTWLFVLINWDLKNSYQKIIGDLEQASSDIRRTVLANVIGDEDNPPPKPYR